MESTRDGTSMNNDDLRKNNHDLRKKNDDMVNKNNDLLKKLGQKEEELREVRRQAEMFREEIREHFESLKEQLMQKLQEANNKAVDGNQMVSTLQEAYKDKAHLQHENDRLKKDNEDCHSKLEVYRRFRKICIDRRPMNRIFRYS